MDELDRLYRRLVQNIRAGFPELLGRDFEASQIYQQIVPYRTNRRELGFESNDQYELALLHLLAGSRGLLTGDSDMQRTLRGELDSANPDLGAFRVFATAAVKLAPEPLRALEREQQVRRVSGVVERRSEAPISSPEDTREQSRLAARNTEALESLESLESVGSLTSPLVQPDAVSPTGTPSVSTSRSSPTPATAGSPCRYCGGALPESRSIVFCPHCGHNVTVRHCPACGTELEVEWKFCITCGRDVAA